MLKDEITDPRERRKEGIRTPVEITVDLSALGTYFLTRMINISIGGAFVCHENIQPIGTVIKISFQLPTDSNPIVVDAQVCWSYKQAGKAKPSSTGMGVKFIQVKDEDQKKIEDYIGQLIETKPKKKR